MKCTNCSTELQEGQKYCPNCGSAAPTPILTSATLEEKVTKLEARVASLEKEVNNLVAAMSAQTTASAGETGLRAWIAKNF